MYGTAVIFQVQPGVKTHGQQGLSAPCPSGCVSLRSFLDVLTNSRIGTWPGGVLSFPAATGCLCESISRRTAVKFSNKKCSV